MSSNDIDGLKLDLFWYWISERHRIYQRKQENPNAKKWTEDPILHKYKFTNPFRENDKVTVWFRENIRDPLKHTDACLMSTIIFKWFNLPETGEVMLKCSGSNEFGLFFDWPKYKEIFRDMMRDQPKKVSGAYIIKTPNGLNKVDGIIWCIDQIWEHREFLTQLCLNTKSLQKVWLNLNEYPFLGPFMSYELVTDLRHTPLLENAADIYTWANPGPGAKRGCNRLTNKDVNSTQPYNTYVAIMQRILGLAENQFPDFKLEMRDIEHSLCEYDKYCRVYYNEGNTPKALYKHKN